ncbi:MAG: tyrosine-type recombinase/integrase [Limisphaerales bacterium]
MNTSSFLVQRCPRSHERYLRLPIFGDCIEDFVRWSLGKGYKHQTFRLHLQALQRLVPRFLRRGIRSPRDLTDDDVQAAARRFRDRKPHVAEGIRAFGRFLKESQGLKPGRRRMPRSSDQIIQRVVEHLRNDCGMAESTWQRHRRHLRLFLQFIGFDRNKSAIRKVTLERVRRFLGLMARRHSPASLKQVVATIRMFLRWEFVRGALSCPLHLQLDTIRIYRDQQTPHVIPWPTLQQLLCKLDRTTSQGLRDFTILLLAATYGLRRSEVAGLTLDDIDWRKRQIRIAQPKVRRTLWLPLTNEVETALIRYLKRGRPETSLRHVFICQPAPMRPLSPYGVYNILGRASRTTGVLLPTRRVHSLRYARALSLMRKGVSLKAISDVLGHQDVNTSAHYLRLDVDDLRQVALPVPTANVRHSQIPSKFVSGSLPPIAASNRRPSGTVTDARGGWHSFLGKAMEGYISLHRALGREFQTVERTLRSLDFVLARKFPNSHIFTERMFATWSRGILHVSGDKARPRLMCVRKFCLHLTRTQPKTFIPDHLTFPRQSAPQAPCLLSPSDIARLVEATRIVRPKPKNPLRHETMRLAILLVYCCGLRLGELLRLRIQDIDSARMLLRLNHTKFNKSRLVPLSPSLADVLNQYFQQRRRKGMPLDPQSPLVWSSEAGNSRSLSAPTFRANWHRICHAAGVWDGHRKPPRVHDLRHSFAVEALRRSYRAGENPQAALPRLSRYMGHVTPACTHYYLQFTEQLQVVAGDRFRRHIADALLASADKEAARKGGVR